MAKDSSTPPSVVSLRNLTRRFGEAVVLDGLDLDIAAGEFVALLGRSGSGKTTLLRTLAGIDAVADQDAVIPDQRAVVFQEARLLPWRTVLQNVAIGLKSADNVERSAQALAEVGLSHRASAWPATLSGGEAQRAALARALVREPKPKPKLLLLDEPFAALDALTRLKMHDLVLRLWRTHGCAVMMVTHDVDEALLLADRVLLLEGGRIVSSEAPRGERPRSTGDEHIRDLRHRLLTRLAGVDAEPFH